MYRAKTMSNSLKIAIITGGSSSERQVSLWSAQTVANILKDRYKITVHDFPNDINLFIQNRKEYGLAIPVIHGAGGEDGTLQGFLKTLGVPFLFSDALPHAMGMNKAITKNIALSHGLNTISSSVLGRLDSFTLKSPVIIKPIDGGSTIGMAKANTQDELVLALNDAFQHSNEVLVEDFIEGREFTAGVLEENGLAKALPIIEIVANGVFDFESKYVAGKMAKEICPADLSGNLTREIQGYAVRIHKALKLKHLSRSDFIMDRNGKIWFLETNTIPGMTVNSLWPKALSASGRNLEDVFGDWIEEAAMDQSASPKTSASNA